MFACLILGLVFSSSVVLFIMFTQPFVIIASLVNFQGDFSVNDAYTLLPFSNTMFNLVMTGEQIMNVLEDALDFYLDPTGSWGAYPRASGLRFDVNEALPKGSRVSNLEVNAKLAASWAPIDMSATYTVVTNNYIVIPKDGYYEFGNVDDSLKYDTYVEYAQSFIEYAESVGVLAPVSVDRASTQNWTDKVPETTSPTGSPTGSPVKATGSPVKATGAPTKTPTISPTKKANNGKGNRKGKKSGGKP